LEHVARALDVPLTVFLTDEPSLPTAAGDRSGRIALIGMRGAGKSTLGKRLAARRGVPFIELDREIEREAGVSIAAIFELYGQSGYHRLERTSLDAVLQAHPQFVLATGGSIVSEYSTFARLLERCFTVWLRATPSQHMERVIAQGDMRPMSGHPRAMNDLKRLLEARRPLYERADRIVDTSRGSVAQTFGTLCAALPDVEGRKS
jgi:XRE family aerobic/anaerobic benzoate catabolism transcriptional regulator